MIPTYSKIYDAFVEVRMLRTFILKSFDEIPEYKYQIKNTLLTDYIKFMRSHSLDLLMSCLNPYSTGRYSVSLYQVINILKVWMS